MTQVFFFKKAWLKTLNQQKQKTDIWTNQFFFWKPPKMKDYKIIYN
jgi:hypothetical protein